jgi:hypothetical protein
VLHEKKHFWFFLKKHNFHPDWWMVDHVSRGPCHAILVREPLPLASPASWILNDFEVAMPWKQDDQWRLPGGIVCELQDVQSWLGPQLRIGYTSYSISLIGFPYQCHVRSHAIQNARLKGQGKDELAEVWERLLTFAQDPGNDDEGVAWAKGVRLESS